MARALPEAAWEAIFAEHERDHQHADARREGCNGCAMLAYAESLRARVAQLERVLGAARAYLNVVGDDTAELDALVDAVSEAP